MESVDREEQNEWESGPEGDTRRKEKHGRVVPGNNSRDYSERFVVDLRNFVRENEIGPVCCSNTCQNPVSKNGGRRLRS